MLKHKKEIIQFIALFCIELILFLPIYISEVHATQPTISNIEDNPGSEYVIVTWNTNIESNSILKYGRTSSADLTKTSSEITTSHSVELNPLDPTTRYYYKVKSCVDQDCTTSSLYNFETLNAPAPDKIIGLTNSSITTRTILIKWGATTSNYFGYYIVYRNGNPIANITSKTTTEYLDQGLNGATTYIYEVSAVNSGGLEGESSNQLYLTTLIPDTTAPKIENVSITSMTTDSITIGWTTNEPANSTIKYGSGNYNSIISTASFKTTHSLTLTNLQNETAYVYKIISCDVDKNCAEKSDTEAFVPTELKELTIDLTVPTIYSESTIPVNGTVTEHTKVRFFVNNIYKGLILIERNPDGEITFNVPGFTQGNNTLRVVVEDSVGNKKEKDYVIEVDLTPPVVEISALPKLVSYESVSINGTSSEPVNVKIYVELIKGEDTTAPNKVTNLHEDSVQTNSIEIAWINLNDSDLKEYIIYRDGIIIGTTVSSPYEDDYIISSGQRYKYEIVAVDTSCNIGSKTTIYVTSEEGGVVYNETPEEETIDCIDKKLEPTYTLENKYPTFEEIIELNQGTNKVTIEVSDKAGNIIKEVYEVYYDTNVPEILDTNLESISPSYIRDVTITGTVSEDSLICVYINSDVDISGYRYEEITNSENFSSEDMFCEYSINKEFAIDIELSRDSKYAYDTSRQSDQTTWTRFETGTAWRNDITIFATDNVGLKSDAEEGEIIYALCGTGGEWSFIVDKISPTEIVPRHLLEGMAQIGFSVDLIWRGSGNKSGVVDIDIREGYPMGMSADYEDKFDSDWVSQIYDTAWSDEYDKGYVLLDLKAQDPYPHDDTKTTFDREENLTKHNKGNCFITPFTKDEESYIKEAGCVRVPLTATINYERSREVRKGNRWETRKETITQKECITLEVLIQPRVDPELISNSLLEDAVDFLNTTIEFIDEIIEPLKEILEGTMIACLGLWVVVYLKKVTEGMSCLGVNVNKECKCNAIEGGLDCGPEDEDKLVGNCKTCLEAKLNTYQIERLMKFTCDRIMCPAVPSYEKYIKDNQGEESKSNCAARTAGPAVNYDKEDNSNKDICKNTPKGLVGPEGPIISKAECCDEEYMSEWSGGCVLMNELKESKKLDQPKGESAISQAWRGVSNFKLCRPGENDERHVNINGQWFVMTKTPNYESLKEEQKEKTFEWNVWVGKNTQITEYSKGKVIKDNQTVIKDEGQELTGTVIIRENCKKYGKEKGYMFGDEIWWPRYTKTTSGKETINQIRMETTVRRDELLSNKRNRRAATNEKLTKEELDATALDPTETITRNGIEYTFKDQGTNYELVKGDGYYIDGTKVFRESKGDKEPARTKDTDWVPESIVRDACSGFAEDYIVDPTANIFRSIQCVCLSAFYSYLQMYRKVLGLIRDCFNTILITGDGSSGVCEAVISYYICDLLYYLFSCFKGYSGFGTKEASKSTSLDFLRGVVGAGAEVQQSVSNRYGSTNMFNVMFVEKKLIHSACMSFFGIDADIDLAGIVEDSIQIPIASTIATVPTTRRFVGHNPIDGITSHIYHVGLMVVSGSDNMRYDVKLVCSTDNQCDSGYFDGGYCDCAHNGAEKTKDITNEFSGNGRLDQGDIVNEEAYIPVSYTNDDAKVRYDTVRVEYDFLNNQGKIERKKTERKIGQIGTQPLANCKFDILAGYYRCSIFEEPTTSCIIGDAEMKVEERGSGITKKTSTIKSGGSIYDLYNNEKTMNFKFKARKDLQNTDKTKNFFAILTITSGSRSLITRELLIDTEKEKDYIFKSIRIRESWFADTSYSNCRHTTEGGNMGIRVEECKQEAKITCEETKKNNYIFTIETGDVTTHGSSKSLTPSGENEIIKIEFDKENTQKSRDGFKIRKVSSIKCGGSLFIETEGAQEGYNSADSRQINYALKIYRPDSDNPSRRSEIIAKCDGIRQIQEGTINIYQDEKPAKDGEGNLAELIPRAPLPPESPTIEIIQVKDLTNNEIVERDEENNNLIHINKEGNKIQIKGNVENRFDENVVLQFKYKHGSDFEDFRSDLLIKQEEDGSFAAQIDTKISTERILYIKISHSSSENLILFLKFINAETE
jgi:hypothetical protein